MKTYNYKQQINRYNCIVPPKNFSQFLIKDMITVNKTMINLLQLCTRVAKSDASIMITGESGVGKELVAELIHHNSKRSDQPFIKLNCSAIPEDLLESEFFGYEPGAFTGALKNGKHGIVELADRGTLFLDEIAEMPMNLQPKILRFLENGKYRKIGGDKEFYSDVRIISATNKSLINEISKSSFRQDLYFRLNVIPIDIPPLRKRKEDIPIISLFFLNHYNSYYNTNKKLTKLVIEKLINYDWPGNVRELKNIMERLVLISLDNIITENDLSYCSFTTKQYSIMKNNIHNQPYNNTSASLKEIVTTYEMKVISDYIEKYGSIRKAANALQVSPSTLSRKISSFNENID